MIVINIAENVVFGYFVAAALIVQRSKKKSKNLGIALESDPGRLRLWGMEQRKKKTNISLV